MNSFPHDPNLDSLPNAPFTGTIRTIDGDSIAFANCKLTWKRLDLRIVDGLIVAVDEVPEERPIG